MRTRFFIGVAVLAVILFWFNFHPKGMVPPSQSKQIKLPKAHIAKEEVRPVVPPPVETEESFKEKVLETTRAEMRDITFYGKVLDEKESPVTGVTIKFSVHDLSKSARTEHQATSDNNGLFSLTGIQGRWMEVEISKEGYYTPVDEYRFYEYYNRFAKIPTPDLQNPVIFHLRKKGEAEAMVRIERKISTAKGGAIFIDLRTATAGLAVEKLCAELLENEGGKAPKWEMRLSVPNGGILPALEEFPFTAPEAGYQTLVQLGLNSKLPSQWIGIYKGGRFYVKTPSGYGLVELKMVPGSDYMRILSCFNPSGSRNLEFDPKKEIKPTGY